MKKNIAIVAGGNSGEYEISIQSGSVVEKNLDTGLYNPYMIVIKGSDWYYLDKEDKKIDVDKNDFSIIIQGEKIIFDCVFIAIHGTPGEDGKLQGYFDLLAIPYTSCNQTISALTFNKSFCNRIVNSLGVNTAKSILLYKNQKYKTDRIVDEIKLPCFVKPNNGGSSVGITKVDKIENLQDAIKTAFKEDDEVIIEEFIDGTEITCSIIKSKSKVYVLPITEIVSKKEFFDYDAKYTPGMADEITPARISEKTEKECKTTSVYLYKNLNCSGLVRFDYILHDELLFFLEVNTVPGLTEDSIIPRQAKEMGITITKLFTMAIEDAIDRKNKF
jgi:D-alanine-D-alanine ligase